MDRFGGRIEHLVSALSKCKRDTLRVLDIDMSYLYGGLDDSALEGLIKEVANHCSLTRFLFNFRAIGDGIKNNWCDSLGGMLRQPSSKLEELKLRSSNYEIDDLVVSTLGNSLIENSVLKRLDLQSSKGVTGNGWISFFECLSNVSSLEELDLSGNHTVSDEAAESLATSLATNTSLKTLDLDACLSISSTGWQAFFNKLQTSSSSAIEKLYMRSNHLSNAAVPSMVTIFTNMGSLKILQLNNCTSITASGWETLSSIVHPNSRLEEFYLDNGERRSVTDTILISIANGLINNRSLKILELQAVISNPYITQRGWDAITSALCNESSIDSIFTSNHTIQQIGFAQYERRDGYNNIRYNLPGYLESYLKMNANNNKYEVAREKILWSYFSGGRNVNEFLDMELNVLPLAIAWMGIDYIGQAHSLLYEFVQCMPALFDPNSKKASGKVVKKKRKV